MLLFPKGSLENDLEKGMCEWEPGPPKPATELPGPKAWAPRAPVGPAAVEPGKPEAPGDPNPEAAGVLNEKEAADVISGFPNPRGGVEVVMAELAEGAAPKAGTFPNTGELPEGAVANPEVILKLKF